jgi:hypothetical protein
MTPVKTTILKRLAGSPHRQIIGSCQIYTDVPANEGAIRRALADLRRHHLICSSHSHGGRGRKAAHRLTQRGLNYILAELGEADLKD